MAICIALLRAVNVGGHKKVGTADLRELLTGLGMVDVRPLLQSGNVVFRSDVRAAAQFERLLEDAAAKRLRLETDFFVRTVNDWNAIINGNPFKPEAQRDPSHLLVMLLKDGPHREDVTALESAIMGRERVRAVGRHVYIVCPDGIGRSRLTTAFIEKKLGTSGTGRNWNTVLKLGALAEGLMSALSSRGRSRIATK